MRGRTRKEGREGKGELGREGKEREGEGRGGSSYFALGKKEVGDYDRNCEKSINI